MKKPKAVLMGPFVGEFYWEAGRFAPLLPYMAYKEYKKEDVKFIILTREERFDLYGKYADILVPLRISGDYKIKRPECFRLIGLRPDDYKKIANDFKRKYNQNFNIIKHIYPDVRKGKFVNKNQFPRRRMMFKYKPRQQNYDIVDSYLPNDKPIVVFAPRFRKGFKRNWNRWPQFYDKVATDKQLMKDFYFIICGKHGEYIPDENKRFLDLNFMNSGSKSSLVGLLMAVLERAFFTFGSQSAIPNLSLLYGVNVLEFGCQRSLHTKTYNIKNTPVTFIDDRNYDIGVDQIFPKFKKMINNKRRKENATNNKHLDKVKRKGT